MKKMILAALLLTPATGSTRGDCSDYSIYCYRHAVYAHFDHYEWHNGYQFKVYCHGYGYDEHCIEIVCE